MGIALRTFNDCCPADGKLCSIGYLAFPHHLADMNFHSALCHAESSRNHLVGLSKAKMIENLQLARRQAHWVTSHVVL